MEKGNYLTLCVLSADNPASCACGGFKGKCKTFSPLYDQAFQTFY